MTRDLNQLHPIVRAKAEAWMQLCRDHGIEILIYFTFRSIEEQNELYQIGRRGRKGEKIVTKARGGESSHNYRASFDAVPMREGKPWWKAPERIWQLMGKLAEQVGLDWLGDEWGEYLPWDKGHFQEPGWKHIKELLLLGFKS